MKKYLVVKSSPVVKFPTVLFVMSDDQIEVYSDSDAAKEEYEEYVRTRRVNSLEALASRFTYCTVEIHNIDRDNEQQVRDLIDKLSSKRA